MNPPGGRYALCLQEVRLLAPNDPRHENPLLTGNNIAPAARLVTSPTLMWSDSMHLVDGIVGLASGGPPQDWLTTCDIDSGTVRLTWTEPQRVDRIWLFPPGQPVSPITDAMLIFSDGSMIPTGPIPNDPKQGLQIDFMPRLIEWLVLLITRSSPPNPFSTAGLSELAVFAAK
ncbi:MAG: hypothetical protein HY360_12200 [Verrucomicrobia bacterium]|nr:hypothetical protein [Verrucomicrobiota bacterium]